MKIKNISQLAIHKKRSTFELECLAWTKVFMEASKTFPNIFLVWNLCSLAESGKFTEVMEAK